MDDFIPITWEDILQREIIKLYAGDFPSSGAKYAQDFIALSLPEEINHEQNHAFIRHDITKPMPLPDNSVNIYQSEDVFEHIEYHKLISVMNEIYRVLKPKGLLRLSVPDYRYDAYYERSLKNSLGVVVFDFLGGGDVSEPGHKWFPIIESVRHLIEQTNFANGSVEFLHYYDEDGKPVTKTIDYSKGFISRTPDNTKQNGKYRPISIVVDMIK